MPNTPDTASTTTEHLPATVTASTSPAPQHFSREQQCAFLRNLAEWGNVGAAARACGVSRNTAYRLRRACEDFAMLWDAALLVARPRVEEVLADRAIHGVEEKVFYHGEEVATRRRYDARLLLAHLARLDRLTHNYETREAALGFDYELGQLAQSPEFDWSAAG